MKHNGLIALGLWVLTTTLFACSAVSQQIQQREFTKQPSYTVNHSPSGKPYYHLRFVINSENLLRVERYSLPEFEQNGGQFEVKLKKTAFPISAPNCESDLILRMPWVAPGTNLDAKYQLYQAILAVQLAQMDQVPVVLELNPYVLETPHGIELSQCNVFFRHANSQYVPHTNSVFP